MPWEKQIGQGNRALLSGLPSEAFDHFRKAIDESASFAKGDSLWAEAHRGLAKAALELGKLPEAADAARTAVQTDEAFWGYDCASVCEDLYLLAEALRRQGQFESAKPLLERALNFFSQQFGDTHQQSLLILASLVLVYLESGQENGYRQLHARAFSAYQAGHPTGMWVTFLGLPSLVEQYERAGESKRLEEILGRELATLRNMLGGSHREVASVLECHAAVMKRAKRSLAAWQLQGKTTGHAKPATADSLFFSFETSYPQGASTVFRVIERLLSLSMLPRTACAPSLLRENWWHIGRHDAQSGKLEARLEFDDGRIGRSSASATAEPVKTTLGTVTAPTSGAEIEWQITISAAPGNSCNVQYQWCLHRSSSISRAREIMQYMFSEINSTLSVLPPIVTHEVYVDSGGALQAQRRIGDGGPVGLFPTVAWPTPQQYNEAVQTPTQSFIDGQLREAVPDLNALGLPRPFSGAFATVYRLRENDNQWAVKCFTERVSDQQARYKAIADRLHALEIPFFTEFDYQSDGVKVQGRNYPIVKMRWMDGQPLNTFIVSNLHRQSVLLQLAQAFYDMVEFLEFLGIAHGDLQHGNILVDNGKLMLVDYDGMYVSELAGSHSNELGHRNYQHPGRTQSHFGTYLDNFSAWVIYASLFSVARDPSLWDTLNAGDEALLFKREDFLEPERSPVFAALCAHADSDVKNAGSFLMQMLTLEVPDIPSFAQVFKS